MTKFERQNPIFFKKKIYDFEAPEKYKKMHSPVQKQLPQLPAQSALSSAFMVKNAFRKTRIWLGSKFNEYHMMLKIEF
jgi:hypothetical protein